MLFELVHKAVEMENESFFYGKIDDIFFSTRKNCIKEKECSKNRAS